MTQAGTQGTSAGRRSDGTAVPSGTVRPSASPRLGGLVVGSVMLAAFVIITYTIVPLPGQRGLGAWNYVVAGGLFVLSMVFGAVNDARNTHVRRSPSSGPADLLADTRHP